jgi:hypothetical protein
MAKLFEKKSVREVLKDFNKSVTASVSTPVNEKSNTTNTTTVVDELATSIDKKKSVSAKSLKKPDAAAHNYRVIKQNTGHFRLLSRSESDSVLVKRAKRMVKTTDDFYDTKLLVARTVEQRGTIGSFLILERKGNQDPIASPTTPDAIEFVKYFSTTKPVNITEFSGLASSELFIKLSMLIEQGYEKEFIQGMTNIFAGSFLQ